MRLGSGFGSRDDGSHAGSAIYVKRSPAPADMASGSAVGKQGRRLLKSARRGFGMQLTVACAAMVIAAIAAAPASAADTIRGYSYAETAPRNAPEDQLTAGRLACPSGKPVVGGGVDSSGGFNDPMMIYSSRPYDGQDSDSIPEDGWDAQVDRLFGSSAQSIKVYRICDTLKSASSYAYSKKTVSVGEGTQGTVSVPCPNGHPVVGGGVASTGGSVARMWVHSSGPYDGSDTDTLQDDGWRASVANVSSDDPFAHNVTAYAICDKTRPQSAYSYLKKTVPVAENAQVRADVLCATSSQVVVGGGVSANGDYDDKVFVNTSRPTDGTDIDTIEDDGWRAAVDNSEGIVSDHTANLVTVYAICRR